MELRTISVYSEAYAGLLNGIKVSQFMKTKQPHNVTIYDIPNNIVSADNTEIQKKSCSFCKVEFQDLLSQRQHYKLDWHRYNLKLNLKQRKPITEEDFTTKAVEDDVSSISGSETESVDDSESHTIVPKGANEIGDLITRRMRIIFENSKGNFLSLSRCWFVEKKDQIQSDTDFVATAKKLPSCSRTFVVMLGGGHFAASIFQKTEVIQHKTFHSYTVRAKQGGSQSMKDNKQSASKSAGASLRRYNERSLMQHVQEILANWSKDIASCDYIFIRAVGPNNQSILFSGKQASLRKNDERIRKIPFPTRRATFNETRRVHSLLTSIDIYESVSVFESKFLGWSSKPDLECEMKEKAVVKTSQTKTEKKSKSAIPTEEQLLRCVAQLHIQSDSSDHSEKMSETEHNEMSSNSPEVTSTEQSDRNKKVRKKKKKKVEKEPESKPEEHIMNFRVDVFTACTSGNADNLEEVLNSKGDNIPDEEVVIAMNQMTPDNLSLLQFAAKNNFNEIVHLILLNGGDPCVKNPKSMTAYDFATEKETRNVFRRFMGDFPDRYDYSKSHIPSALTDDAKKRQKAVKKAKRMREKERKKADEPRKIEIAEQKRFLQMDDREKRALAAERRIQASLGKSGKDLVLLRCYRCAINITGKVPFHYENYSFCSMQCLKEHRQSQPINQQ